MTPDNPFLQALLAEPEDDTLRLAMADWLDERDQPGRAEFIRLQIELACGVTDRYRLRTLEMRQRDLLITNEREWVAPLAKVLRCKPGQWGGWVFRRGFVEYFHLPATIINKYGSQLTELTPVRELFLRPCNSENVIALCRQPWMNSVTHLYLDDVRLTSLAARELYECPHLTNLQMLRYAAVDLSVVGAARFHERFQHMLKAT